MKNIDEICIEGFFDLLFNGSGYFSSYDNGNCLGELVPKYHKENFGVGFFEYE